MSAHDHTDEWLAQPDEVRSVVVLPVVAVDGTAIVAVEIDYGGDRIAPAGFTAREARDLAGMLLDVAQQIGGPNRRQRRASGPPASERSGRCPR